eukprot:gene665-11979_t
MFKPAGESPQKRPALEEFGWQIIHLLLCKPSSFCLHLKVFDGQHVQPKTHNFEDTSQTTTDSLMLRRAFRTNQFQ